MSKSKFINITASEFRCSLGACPAVYEDITDGEYRCDVTVSCPAVFENHKSGNFVFVGQHLDPVPEDLAGKVGESEAAVSISKDLVLASLGMDELIAAAVQILDLKETYDSRGDACRIVPSEDCSSLRAAVSKAKGGD